MRPFRSRNTVNFNGRTGIVRLALERGVPVLPVAGSEVKLALLNGPIAAASVAALLVGVMAA